MACLYRPGLANESMPIRAWGTGYFTPSESAANGKVPNYNANTSLKRALKAGVGRNAGYRQETVYRGLGGLRHG